MKTPFANVKIGLSLVKDIKKIQKDMQINENIKKGRKAKKQTFLSASNKVSKMFKESLQ